LRSVQEWEAGDKFPTAERLQALIGTLLQAGGLASGREAAEARQLWTAAERDAPRMRTPFDEEWFAALLMALGPAASEQSTPASSTVSAGASGRAIADRTQDWGEAPDIMGFVGRAQELALLQRWLLEEGCRLLTVLGMGGIGKTSLAARLAHEVAPSFARVYWRSLRNAPPVSDWLAGAIGFLSDQQLVPPTSESERIAALLRLLRAKRCLLILDNSETLFAPGERDGRYRPGMDGYGRLLQAVGATAHQSSMLVTSREAPPELAALGGGVRTLELHGLGTGEAQALLADKQLIGDSRAWASLVERYSGNGLALKIVSETIRQVYDGDLVAFLADAIASYGTVFGGIRRLLDVQADRLSPLEYDVLTRLTVEREPVSLAELARDIAPGAAGGTVVDAVETLRRRSLVERGERGASFTLQSMVLEYVTDRLVERVAEEIERGQPVVLLGQPLIKARAKEYVRQTQERLIGAAILQRVGAAHDAGDLERRLLDLLHGWRGRSAREQGYGPGNVVNLLRLLRGDLRELDLSDLSIRDAYLAEVDAQRANLAGAHLAETVLGEALYLATSVVMSGNSTLLAVGTSRGEVWLWRLPDRTAVLGVRGHTGAIWGLALSADGRLVASGGAEGAVRLWDASTGRALATLEAHVGGVWGVALSSDGQRLATCGGDGLVRLWDARTGQLLATLQGHIGVVWRVALSADGRLAASGGGDGTVRVWHARAGRVLATLDAHAGGVWGVALSADGQLLASCGDDGTVRLWRTTTGKLLATLQGHRGVVWRVALSSDGHLLVSGGDDGIVRLWETRTGQLVANLQGHVGVVQGLALSVDGELAASCGDEGTVRLWETRTAQPVAILHGHVGQIMDLAMSRDGQVLATKQGDGTVQFWAVSTGRLQAALQVPGPTVWRVALSADGRLAVTGAVDGGVGLWDTSSGQPLGSFQSHAGVVWGVALSDDGQLIATCGGDGTVRLWETSTGRAVATLRGHKGVVWRVALSANGQVVASGGEDGTVRIWETRTGRPVATLQGHTGVVWRVALSANGQVVASGGEDRTVRVWQTRTGQPVASLTGHSSMIRGLALSADGQVLASCSLDGTVRLWHSQTGQSLRTLRGHAGGVLSLALSADGQLLASGGFDGDVRLWDASIGTCIRTIQAERRYERLDVTGLTGVTDAQRKALLALGAVERAPAPV
jgi:WD40 repeat protein